ncbi:MAG: sulfurtransferase TusA family protein [Gammaproteobacteria bacterium]|nr:sulfurtransferase TusA family protein [Gammaproteobacteria bacterium]MDH5593880.1 sulfurtransferase TusA family protein [Gammaproteobacteria bacterium]
MAKHNLDARGLLCPMPVIRAQNAIADLPQGDVLEVVCTDPGAAHDIPAWCRVHGHSILEIKQKKDELVVIIEVGEANA